MASVSEGVFKIGDTSLYTKTWTPQVPTRAQLVFVHGFSDHINRYDEIFKAFAARGILVSGWDQRGWGRSVTKPAQRGLTGPTSLVTSDMAAFLRDRLEAQKGSSSVPTFVMGHSMGGGEVLTLAGDAQYADLVGEVRGWILEAPFIAFPPGREPSRLKSTAGRWAGLLFPRRQLKHVVAPELLSRDAAIVESVREDALCHDTGTLEGLASLLERTAMLSSGRVQLGKNVRSLLLTHGSKDMVCCYEAAVAFVDRQGDVEDKTVKSYQGAYHQLHADHCKDEFTRDVTDWILKRCGDEPVKKKDDGDGTPAAAKL